MAKLNSSFKWQTFTYDFAVDGGAISTIPMGIFISAKTVLCACNLCILISLASGGAAVVDIGLINGSGTEIINNAYGQIGTYVDYNDATKGLGTVLSKLAGFVGSFIMCTGDPATGNPIEIITPGEIGITISAFALTAGNFIATLFYMEY